MAGKAKKKLRTAILGCGRIAQRHGKILAGMDEAELVGMVDPTTAKAEKFSTDFGGRPYASLEEMIAAERPDILNICTPSGLHAEQAIRAAKLGVKNLVVEKPMALRLQDADEMIETCANLDVRLFVVKQNRYNLPIKKLREAIDEGRFGRLVLGTIRLRWCRRQDYYDQAPWRGTWALDGGVFSNQASHHVDMLSYMMGRVESVSAMTTTRLVSIEAEDTGVATLRFRNGALGVIEATTAARPIDLEGSISILGEYGTVEVGGFAMNEIKVWKFAEERPEDAEVREKYKQNPPDVYGFGHNEYLKDVFHSIHEGQQPVVDGLEGRKSLELINAIYESVEREREVHLSFSPKRCRLGMRSDT